MPAHSKVLIVTGGGRGIGACTARMAARRGYSVCVNYLSNREAAANVAADIEKDGGAAIAMQADIGVEADVAGLFERVDRELGTPAALVNNAARLEQQMRLEVNAIGPMLCAREAVPRMSTRHGGGGGAIVNVSSGAARYGSPGEYVDYSTGKGAIETFTVGLAREVAEEGIRVNGVRPGFIDTDLHAAGGEPDRVNRVKTQVPMQRGGQAPEASYVTGTFIDVSGGR